MIEIKLIPQTACLVFKINGELIDYKFYNKLAFDNDEIEGIQFRLDAQEMLYDFLKTHINNMLEFYGWHDCFNSEDIETLMQLTDYTDNKISYLINKFYYINTNIADNGGAPVLKQILQLL